jgi:mannosyltransferase
VEDKERTAVLAATVTVLATLAVAWIVSQVSPAWTTRYLGVLLGPMLLIAALGLARAATLGLVALAIVLVIWAIPKSYGLENKSNASDLRKDAVPELRQGDLVISMQPEQAPLINYHLPGELRFATPLGRVEDPRIMDWTDAQERMESATTQENLEPLLANLPRSSRVLLVHTVTASANDRDAPWTALVRRRSAQWGHAVATDPRFERKGVVPPFYRRSTRIGVRGVLYEKTR